MDLALSQTHIQELEKIVHIYIYIYIFHHVREGNERKQPQQISYNINNNQFLRFLIITFPIMTYYP